jgi:energy-coupling factor transporter ATP-binding protein EcfA2
MGTVKGNFVNVHLLVSPDDPHHVAELNRFLGRLEFRAHDDKFACTPSDLTRLGRRADPTQEDETAALRHGCTQFKVSLDNLVAAYRDMEWVRANILIAVAGGADGSSGVKQAADATLRQEIEKASHAIFASGPKQRDFWLGQGAASISELRARYDGPKPCLWGCDAHDLSRVAKPAEDRHCWIKGAPIFDALKQACIDPERAYVGLGPPPVPAASQVIDEIEIENAPWATTPLVALNPGLVAIIGARGSGKTALADVIATGCDAYSEPLRRPSFLDRAREFLSGSRVTLKWLNGEAASRRLDEPVNLAAEAYPRARYLSQQFVEELCSVEGMPLLIKEIERVIFEAHPSTEREGAVDFEELLEIRARGYRDIRTFEETALADISDQIGIEMEKARQVAPLKAQLAEKEKLIRAYSADRKRLLPKGEDKTAERLEALIEAAEKVRANLRYFSARQASLTGLKAEISDLRQNRAPGMLRQTKEQHQRAGLSPTDWERFLLAYSGDVDSVVQAKTADTEKNLLGWKGTVPPKVIDATGAFVGVDADLTRLPLSVLEAEIARLEKLVAASKQTAAQLALLTKRIGEETAARDRLKERLTDCEGARERAEALTADRESGYMRVFEALLAEESVLDELYAPLTDRLTASGGTLAKLSFTVSRVADVEAWAKRAERDIFDLRGGPFKRIGTLAAEARPIFEEAWTKGGPEAVSQAMALFRETYEQTLLDEAPVKRTDPARYRPWSRRFAQWLYSTDHISIEYGIRYDGIDITKLSPGTRGIVLVLLYLALDDADDRPLIIDQPEENLDPKSIYDELVPLFQAAKRRRQVIMVTHNANLVVNSDADQIIVAEVGAREGDGLPPIRYQSGGLEEPHIRKMVCDILEGGETAFQDRARRLRIALAR